MTYHSTMTKIDATQQALVKKPTVRPDLQTVTEVTHWTDSLFSFCITRPASFPFRAGEFVMINKYLIRVLIEINKWNDDVKNAIIKNNGSIQNIEQLSEKIKEKYKKLENYYLTNPETLYKKSEISIINGSTV